MPFLYNLNRSPYNTAEIEDVSICAAQMMEIYQPELLKKSKDILQLCEEKIIQLKSTSALTTYRNYAKQVLHSFGNLACVSLFWRWHGATEPQRFLMCSQSLWQIRSILKIKAFHWCKLNTAKLLWFNPCVENCVRNSVSTKMEKCLSSGHSCPSFRISNCKLLFCGDGSYFPAWILGWLQ